MDSVAIYYDAQMLEHDPRGWDPNRPEWTAAVQALLSAQYADKPVEEIEFSHPERPQRLSAIVDQLTTQPVPGAAWITPPAVTEQQLLRVHTPSHVAAMQALQGRSAWLSQDTTAISPRSVHAAALAAGAGVAAVDALRRGEHKRAFCLVRPPGHHALADSAMGFCLYNNVAIAAAHARAQIGAQTGYQRILIWDWDLHHGNGTQAIFYADPQVALIDSHCQAPFYPGSGALEETGTAAGLGRNFNVPLPAGSGNAALLRVADDIVGPFAAAWKPDLILVSAGFDAHHLDQTFAMDETGFANLTQRLCRLADQHCDGRLIMLLEGGYSAVGLAGSAHACISVLAGGEAPSVTVLDDDPGIPVVEQAAAFHRTAIQAAAR